MNKMLKNKKRNNTNCFSCNNSGAFNTCGSKYKPNSRQQRNN